MGVRLLAGMAAVAAALMVATASQPVLAEAKCPLNGQAYLLFDEAKTDAKRDRREIKAIAEKVGTKPLCVIAHVDSTGDVNYTRRLAIRRALYVVDQLAENGVRKEQMVVELRHIDGDVHKTPDRTVEVIVGY